MIEEHVSIHDRFSIEFKLGFRIRKESEVSDFTFNMWTFSPNSLDINLYTYSKRNFYRDIKSNIRLITPTYLLRDISNEDELPFQLLKESFSKISRNSSKNNISEYESHIKMFQSILKSSIRDEILHIQNCQIDEDKNFLISSYIKNCYQIGNIYRSLRKIINIPTLEKNLFEYYLFADEFMSNLIELQTFRLLENLMCNNAVNQEKMKLEILKLINHEIDYKKSNGYPIIEKDSIDQNQNLVNRFGYLKKYIESQLFLNIRRREDGIVVRQIYYSLAAGISMIFATIIAFSFQLKYGNFTTPLFIALIISYMLKDRIKELTRHYFSYKLNSKYFDTKTDISINDVLIGWYKESQAFVTDTQVPPEIIQLRNRSAILEADNRINDEKIIYYRTQMQLNRKKIMKSSIYPISGVNNVIRFNISQFIQKMDNPKNPLYITDENVGYQIIEGEKVYFLNFVLHFKYLEQQEFKRYRITFNREGIKALERF